MRPDAFLEELLAMKYLFPDLVVANEVADRNPPPHMS